MDQLVSALIVIVTHLVSGVFGMFLLARYIEPWYKSKKNRNEIERISWLFPISKGRPEIHFMCSLKPQNDFSFTKTNDTDNLIEEFFGKNPPTYRKYVHSSEVLALQRITEWLTSRGVQLVPDAFYGGIERSTNLLLIGSGANVEMSKYILDDKLKNFIGYPKTNDRHRYFTYGAQEFGCSCSELQFSNSINRVTEDSGIIVRITRLDGNTVLLLAGIHMHGTLAAAEVALNPAFQKRVLEYKYRNFAQIVRVKVLENGISIDRSSLDQWQKLPFINLD